MRLAEILFSFAQRLMPPGRAEWLDAMRAESDHLHGVERIRWALGGFITALKQRFAPMDVGNFRVSRWVMLIEAVGAFGPLTLAWWAVSFESPGILMVAPELIDKVFMHSPGGPFILAMFYVSVVAWLIGPIGLFLGLRYALTGQGIRNRAVGWTLVAIPIVVQASSVVAGFFVGPPDWDFDLFADGTALLVLVPAAVLWHLMAIAQTASATPPRAAIAS